METMQKLMDEAYDTFKDKSREEFIASLDKSHTMAVMLGNLNYQVCNGGFRQWVDNGYCTEIDKVKEFVEEIGTDNAKRVLSMLSLVEVDLSEDVLNGECASHGWGGNYFRDDVVGEQEEDCYDCNGTGEIEDPNDPDETIECDVCGGDGVTREWLEGPNYNKHDTEFYTFNDTFMEEVNSFLEGKVVA